MVDWRFIFEKWVLWKHRPLPHEPKVRAVFKRFKGEVFVDIGSNTGIYSKLAAKRFKRVYSIDPNPAYHAEFQFAISNKRGTAPFYFWNGIGSADSLVKNPHILRQDFRNQDRSIMVETRTFDDLQLVADLVKIDVEGAEFEVTEGMKKYLPRRIILELHDERRESELIQKMNLKGYKEFQIDDTHWLFLADDRLWTM